MKRFATESLYENDVAILKDYRVLRKLVLHKSIRRAGYEVEKLKRGTANDEKLDNSIARTKSMIFELAYCNEWKLFITLTLDPRKYDRKDLKKYAKDLSQWIRNYNKKNGTSIKYLFIPEMHKDGSWHIHGFLMGLPVKHLEINENGYLDWNDYKIKFGWCSIDRIRNNEAAAKYITKYISKNLSECISEMNAKMYYCSQGLRRSQEIKRGTLSANNVPWDYQGEWIKCKWYLEPSSDLVELVQVL